MKTLKLSGIIIIISISQVLVSCMKCVNCEIQNNSVAVVKYNEFCGTPGEAKAFKEDVEYDKEHLKCVTCTLLAADHITILKIYQNIYGNEEELSEFLERAGERAKIENGSLQQPVTYISINPTVKCSD
ncbi:MAG: hypothetical protein HY738_20685 [Bacteroidia bacterium]|nr:hypothetical protein [Bacteroidia bacterium]